MQNDILGNSADRPPRVMQPRRFRSDRIRPVLWIVLGLITISPILFTSVLAPDKFRSFERSLVELILIGLSWINLAWLCRNIGLVLAKQPPEVTLNSEGITIRTVARGYSPAFLLRPYNLWEEALVTWEEFQICEVDWTNWRGKKEAKQVRIVCRRGQSYELKDSVFGEHLAQIYAALVQTKACFQNGGTG